MFHTIPGRVLERMEALEAQDARDREDGTPRMERLRQIPQETGRFLAILAASSPPGRIVEIGTSAGYSTLWLALAARVTERVVITYEVLPAKAEKARDTFSAAGMDDAVTLVHADARQALTADTGPIAFCFLDAEKEVYEACFDLIVPRLVPGGLLVADNALSHRDELEEFISGVLDDERVDSLVVPIGRGELVCRKV